MPDDGARPAQARSRAVNCLRVCCRCVAPSARFGHMPNTLICTGARIAGTWPQDAPQHAHMQKGTPKYLSKGALHSMSAIVCSQVRKFPKEVFCRDIRPVSVEEQLHKL